MLWPAPQVGGGGMEEGCAEGGRKEELEKRVRDGGRGGGRGKRGRR